MSTLNTRIVLRNDSTANWLTNESQVLLKGEVGIEFLTNGKVKMKIGDGVTAWSALSYFGGEESHVFEAILGADETHAAAIERVVGETELAKGDIAIVKVLIADDKYEYTAYVYDGSVWTAMDGNYSAENVYFDEDFTFTKAIGTVTIPSTGSTTVTAAGKNIKEFFAGLFAAEQDPKKTDPSVSVTLTGAGEYEVGTVVNPSYSASFEDGKYTYGPEPTGATVTTWAVTSTAGESFDAASGTCAAVTVGDNTNYTVTASATYTEGSLAKTNLGNDSTVQIAAGTKSKTSSAITGYRKSFYGSATTAVELTSDNIRALAGNDNSSVDTLSVDVVEGAKQVIVAVPTGRVVTKIADEGAFGTDIFSKFVLNSVDVEGANDYAVKAYNVYVYSPDAALGANTYTVTVANA